MLDLSSSHPARSSSGDAVVIDLSSSAQDVAEIDSRRLLQGQRELYIRHGNECYRLRHTRNDKLILTK